jgi:hypothetical protein
MAIVRQWIAVEALGSGATVTVAVPAGHTAVAGDVLVVCLAGSGHAATAPTSTGVTWVNQIASLLPANGISATIFTGVVTSTQAAATSYLFTCTSDTFINATMMDYSGVDKSVSLVQTTQTLQNASAASINQSATLSDTNETVVCLITTLDAKTYTLPATFNVILNDGTNALAVFDKTFAAAGATGNITTSWTTGDPYCAVLIAFNSDHLWAQAAL